MSDENGLTLRTMLRAATPARVAMERAGDGVSTREWLDFKLAHAMARDAVHAELQAAPLVAELRAMDLDCVALTTQAADRGTYLRRPELGRLLSAESAELLRKKSKGEIAIVVADGLSALAVERHAAALLRELLPLLDGEKMAPVCVVRQGRVAVGDAIGAALGAKISVVLIGERPGLSAPDSLGAYLTWMPRAGRTDAERNCISNIRAEGLSYADAAARIAWYLKAAMRLQLTGVDLKDSSTRKFSR